MRDHSILMVPRKKAGAAETSSHRIGLMRERSLQLIAKDAAAHSVADAVVMMVDATSLRKNPLEST